MWFGLVWFFSFSNKLRTKATLDQTGKPGEFVIGLLSPGNTIKRDTIRVLVQTVPECRFLKRPLSANPQLIFLTNK